TTAPVATELLSAANADDLNAVGPYIAPVERDADGTLRPGNLREHIRLRGPSIGLPVTFGISASRGALLYVYDELDRLLVSQRGSESRDHVRRRTSGEPTEEEYKPLRPANGADRHPHAST